MVISSVPPFLSPNLNKNIRLVVIYYAKCTAHLHVVKR